MTKKEVIPMGVNNRNIDFEEVLKAYDVNLKLWKAFCLENYPMSNNRPDNKRDFWNQILNNDLSTEQVDETISSSEFAGGIHLTSTTYQACLRLRALREIGIFPTPTGGRL